MNILLVEDSDADAYLIENALKGSHQFARIRRAATLVSCLEAIQSGGVDMVLLDLHLPDAEGLESLSAIVAMNKRMPIVIITGDDRRESITTAARAGARDYIVKHKMDEKRIVDAVAYVKKEIERGNKLEKGRRLIEDSLQRTSQNANNILNGNNPIPRTNN